MVHGAGEHLVRCAGGSLGEHAVGAGQVDVQGGCSAQVLLRGNGGDDRDLVGGHHAGGEGGGDRGEEVERSAVADQGAGCRRAEVPVPAQPRRHRLQPVELGAASQVRRPDSAGELGGDPVLQLQQRAQAVHHLGGRHGVQVVSGKVVDGGPQLAHATS